MTLVLVLPEWVLAPVCPQHRRGHQGPAMGQCQVWGRPVVLQGKSGAAVHVTRVGGGWWPDFVCRLNVPL